jgi:hypothetical protein
MDIGDTGMVRSLTVAGSFACSQILVLCAVLMGQIYVAGYYFPN